MNLQPMPQPRWCPEELEQLVVVGEKPHDCWTWKGVLTSKEQVPVIRIDNENVVSVREIIWRYRFGEIRPGYVVRVGCGSGGCLNPQHLYSRPSRNKKRTLAAQQRAAEADVVGAMTGLTPAAGPAYATAVQTALAKTADLNETPTIELRELSQRLKLRAAHFSRIRYGMISRVGEGLLLRVPAVGKGAMEYEQPIAEDVVPTLKKLVAWDLGTSGRKPWPEMPLVLQAPLLTPESEAESMTLRQLRYRLRGL